MWKFFDRILRRLTTPAARPSTKRKGAPRRRPLLLEALEARWVPSTYSISANFTSTAVAPGNSLWFSSVVNSVTGLGSSPATIHVTNQTITFTDSFAGSVNLSLPNADLTLTPGLALATTNFDTTNVKWVTNVPTGLAGNDFLSAGALALPSGLHGGDTVTWTATFTSTVSGLSLNWAWAASAYTGNSANYNSVYSTLNVKPCDSSTASSYLNSDKAGTPEAYKSYLLPGATGNGSGNYTGNFSSNKAVSPSYTAANVSIAGIVYNDANNNGVFDTGDTGISGVTLTLSGTTTGNASVTATTTTAADGTYSFTTDSNGNALVAGTYQITETEPVGYYKGSDTVGSVSGSTDGVENTVDVMSSITLIAGQAGTGYNFGEVDPFSVGSVPYPYSSSNSLTNVAFNESEIMYGASVNLATSTFDIFYSDEHALCLGVNQTTVEVSGTTTSGSKTITVATSGLTVGATVSGTGIPSSTTIASIGATTITLNNAATANGTTTLTFTNNYTTAQMPANSSTASAVNPGVGDTNVTGAAGAVDASGRPLFPSLYVTDITTNASSLSGDWQSGGTAVPPSAIYGSWKSYALSVNETTSPATITQTGGTDPLTANGWTLPVGADPVPASVIAEGTAGYGTEIQWSLASLYSSGVLIPGHNYRFYFIIHDGDQNKVGGDVGQAAYDFTYRGPVTIAGNVYNDVYGNGVDGAGDNGIGGVSLTLSGTTSSGALVTATTTTASNGTYTFTTDSNGNLLQGGTYKVTETPPSGYLPGIDTVGLTSWNSGFSTVLANTSTSGPGYVHEAGGSSSDTLFTGANSLDTNSLTKWQETTGTPAASNNIVDAFDSTFNDSLTGHTFLLSGLDRYSGTAGTSVGFWAFQNSVSVNANGTFSGVHTNGDLLFIVNVSVYGATSVAEYEWSGSDSTGSLVQITPAVGAVYVYVNTNAVSVPWSFTDAGGNTSPQPGEFLEIGVDLNAVYGLTVPTFKSFLAETRSGNTTGSSLLDFALGTIGTVSGSFSADGSLAPPYAIGNIVATDGQNGINYNFGHVQPVTVAGLVYQDTNGNGVPDSGEPGIGGVTLTLSGTNNLGNPVTATTTTASNGTYSFTTYNSGQFIPPGTYTITETPPSGYLAGGTNVGTINGTVVGTVVASGTIGSIRETTGQNGINYDFGEVKPVTISGTLYQDNGGTGSYASGDSGIAGVTLTLTGTNGLGQPITATVVTGSGGTYSFTTDSNGNPILPGTYTITETPPSGYVSGSATAGTVNGTTTGTATSGTQIGSISLTSGQNGVNYNFGDVKPVTVGGTVYEDTNDNGVFNTGEPGISGVTLTLSGTNGLGQSITATTTTASGGTYSFTTDSSGNLLRPGTYTITETAPSGYLTGAATVGTVSGTSDGTVVSATKIGTITLTSSQAGVSYNFGNLKPVTVGGTVYEDKNDNGVLDSGEPGISGVTVTLSGTNDQGTSITATATTNASGVYSFTTDSSGNVLRPGTYAVTETMLGGYLTGAASVGTVNGTSDGAVVSATKVGSIVLAESQGGASYNFGNVKPVTVGGTVYEDTNDNGVFNTGEPGISSVTLTLSGTNDQGTSITATVTTNASGVYSFTTDSSGNVLRPGTYAIIETLASGYLAGAASVGTVNGTNDGAVVSATNVGSIALAESQSGVSYNFGNLKPVTVGGTVYEDKNDNGVLDSGEPGISGVTVTLSGTNDQGTSITATATTNASGVYSFTTDTSGNLLRPGTYTITETLPSGYLAGASKVGTVNGTSDGSVVSATKIGSVVLAESQSGINYYFGNIKPVTVGGTVYEDTNDNGVLNSGEPGISGVTLTLSGTNDKGTSISATTTTGSGGSFSFTTDSGGNLLRPGTYTITETLLSGYLSRAATVGTVNGTSDGTVLSVTKIGSVVLAESQSGVSYNFGNIKPVTVGGTVYEDKNDNGALDSGEPGISGVTVTLSGTNDLGTSITATATTNASGVYNFTTDSSGNLLRPGTYAITETLPGGYLTRAATVGTVNGTADGSVVSATKVGSVVLAESQSGVSYNFGDIKAITLGGTVYEDSNDNGVLDSGEPGISSVTVTLSGTNDLGTSITATATTNASGVYSFTTDSSGNALRPGTYTITETQPSGYLTGAATVGTVNGSADGSVVSATKVGSIVMGESQSGASYNFGNVKPVTVGGTVYEDKNDSGSLVGGDAGIAGVTVTLTGTNDQGTSITATATTNASGVYSFTTDTSGNLLRPGTYTITETLPSGYLAVAATVGTVNGSADGTASSATKISSIVFAEGQSGVSYNFGDVRPVTFAGTVYEDKNDNGALDSGEPGISGVTLTLSGTNGQGQSITATATTNASGAYSFTTDSNGNALLPGTYTITETLPSGDLTGAATVGTVNGSADGSVVSATKVGSVVVSSNQAGINYNFGNIKPVTIGGTVYEDKNDSGALVGGDPLLAGVTLTLSGTNDQGTSITVTATTNASGVYSFTTDSSGNVLRPGTYSVTETLPSSYLTRAATVGTVNGSADGSVVSATKIGSVVLAESQSGVSYNFGNLKPVTVGGTVYEDSNDNGVLNSGEPGISGVTLTLSGTNDQGTSITVTATTNASGVYSFTTDSSGNALRPGTYTITETLPGGYLTGAASVGTVNGSSDGSVVSATKIGSVALAESQSGVSYNFGNIKPVAVGGTVYEDTNDSGALVNGDPLLSGVTVTLSGTNDQGTSITVTATTNASGVYSFTTDSSGNLLRPGTYSVTETLPSGYLTRAATVGTVNGSADGSVVSATKIGSVVLAESQSGVSYNFGNLKPISIGGTVYEDTNDSGALVNGDPLVAGVTLTLSGTNDLGTSITATATTNASGVYSFTTDSSGNVLRPGTYTITETVPSGYLANAANVGTVNGSSDGSVVSATKIGSVVLAESQAGSSYNFGDLKPISIGGIVYEDSNDSGALVNGDPLLSGVTVTLSGTNDQGTSITATATTNASGVYSFTTDSSGNLLRPGTYSVTETLPSGYLTRAATVGTVNGSADGSVVSATKIGSVVLAESQSGVSYNFGNLKPITLGGTVYEDDKGLGAYASGDVGIAGVTLTLTGTNDLGTAITATATTNSSGVYSFTTDSSGNVLRPGSYTITETAPSGYLLGAATVGTVNGSTDGTEASLTKISSISMAESQAGINYNFGNVRPVTIAGLVYEDVNGTGVYGSGDNLISGVTVTLTGTNVEGLSVTATAITNANGAYSFTTDSNSNILIPGTYQVTETPPSNYLLGPDSVGTVNGSADGSLVSFTQIGSIVMGSGENGINYDFANVKPVTISGLVYNDLHTSGVYQSGDTGIANITITLTGTNNLGQQVTATTSSATDGTYSFSTDSSGNKLAPGTYTLTETQPAGFVSGAATAGTVNGLTVGTVQSHSVINQIGLPEGQSGVHYNFGQIIPVGVAGYVYVDSNHDTVKDNGEGGDGLADVITLTGTDYLGDSVNLTTTTDATGFYSFTALLPGTYSVSFSDSYPYLYEYANVGTVNGVLVGQNTASNFIGSIVLASGAAGANYDFAEILAGS